MANKNTILASSAKSAHFNLKWLHWHQLLWNGTNMRKYIIQNR